MDRWDLMQHWNLVLPPSRPSALQLARIRSQIQGLDRSKPAAVLGSTPEFRDLLFEAGFETVCVLERNLLFLKSMEALRVYHNTEEIIEGDWIDTLPTMPSRFVVILSDLTSGNIPYELRDRFYASVVAALRAGGLFCDKVLTHSMPHLSVSLLLNKYATLPLNLLTVNSFSCEALFCSELLEPGNIVDSSAFYKILDTCTRSERVRAFVKSSQTITPPGCIWWYGRPWQALEAGYCPGLERIAIDEDESTSPYFRRLKFFALLKKG
jgi:hypothetical protein